MKTNAVAQSRLARKIRRWRKVAAQWTRVLASGRRPPSHAVFILGSGRSGTRVPDIPFEDVPDVISYGHGAPPLFKGVALQDAELHRILRRTRFRAVLVRPIEESHRAPEFLERFPGSKVIWIFRDFRDAINSASAKWTSAPRALRYIASGDLEKAGWRAGGVTAENLAMVRDVYSPDMSAHTANALLWYIRNSLFFDLGLAQRQDVLLVRYEDLAGEPLRYFPEVFDFVGTPFHGTYVRNIYGSSIRRHTRPAIPPVIEQWCEELHSRLLAAYASRRPGSVTASASELSSSPRRRA